MIEPALGQAEALFLELAVLEPGARAERLARCRLENRALAEEVAALLGCHDRAEGFLQSGELRQAAAELEETLPPNSRLADYTILGVLGSGGMGVVYIAEQERPRRTVALKLIRRGLGGKSMLRRFEHEAEVLGRLQHPGIAQIYEAGAAETGSGLQPFIAMELIRGLPLLEYADRNDRDHRARLLLIARVCDAVQHAHQRGFIHRDLKPANILVNEEGDPKILDFGIARATDSDLQINTMQTDAGQLVGTLPYMSPEQFSGNPDEVDTRADVYALGVILHELLTGALPFDVRGRSIAEVAAMVREQDPPRLGTLVRALRGETETIVLRALEKDKTRRYQSAAELGADIRRYLAGEPIEAKRDSAMYVLRKHIRRHRAVASAAATFLVALITFAVVVSVQLQRNRSLARAEAAARLESDLNAARLREELTASSLEQGRLLGRAGNLNAAEDLIWPEYLRNPGSPHAYWGLWELYWRMPCAATLAAHERRVTGVAFIAGGGAFATAGGDGMIRVWDARSLKEVRALRRGEAQPTALAADPLRPRLAAGYHDGSVVLWDAASWEPIHEFRGAPMHRGIAYAPDGSFFVTVAADSSLRVWSPSGEGPLRELSGGGRPLVRVAVGGGGGGRSEGAVLAAVASDDGSVLVWPAGSTEPQSLITLGHPLGVVAVSPDGRWIAAGGVDRLIRIYDAETLEQVRVFGGRNGSILSLSFGSDSATLLASGYWAMEFWDSRTGERRRSMPSHMAVTLACAGEEAGLDLAATEDGLVRVWRSGVASGVVRLSGHRGRTAAEFGHDGSLVATGDESGALRLWDAADGTLLARLDGHTRRVRAIQFHPHGRLMATVADDRLLRVWDLHTGGVAYTVEGCESVSAWSCAFSADGSRLVHSTVDGAVVVRDAATGEQLAAAPAIRNQIISLRFTPDGREIVTVDRTFTIRVWGADGSERPAFDRPPIQPWSVAFTPDGETMLAGSWARTVEIWDVALRRRVAELRGHSALVSRVELNPADPALAISSGADGTIRLWDVPSRRPLAAVELFDGWDVVTASWSPDGRRMLAGSADGTVVVIDPAAIDRRIENNAAYHIARFRGMGESWPGMDPDARGAGPAHRGGGDAPAQRRADAAARVRSWAEGGP